MRKLELALTLAFLAAPLAAKADSEAPNRPHVTTDEYGRCFAHSVPSGYYGTDGRTDVFAVGEENSLMSSFEWFAQKIYIDCSVSDGKGIVAPALVQIGSWPRGHRPNDDTLAIAFHYNGERVARYSTLDIAAGDPKNASCSVSHYTVVARHEGFSGPYSAPQFALTTVDGRQLTFDVITGALIKTDKVDADETRGVCPLHQTGDL